MFGVQRLVFGFVLNGDFVFDSAPMSMVEKKYV